MADQNKALKMDELDKVNGGSAIDDVEFGEVRGMKTVRHVCNSDTCKGALRNFVVGSGGRATCTWCRTSIFL